MNLLSPSFGEIAMWGGSFLRLVGYLILASALFIWWQRLRHWSIAALALAFLIFACLNAMVLVIWAAGGPDSGPSSGLDVAWMIAGLAADVLLLIGAFGFLLAAKQFLLSQNITDLSPPTLRQPPA